MHKFSSTASSVCSVLSHCKPNLTFKSMKSDIKNTSLDLLPSLVIKNIFKFLSARDIFDFGRCSKRMNRIVLDQTSHPLTTELQCIKTLYKHYFKETSVYDEIERFQFMDKCEKSECRCQNYRQRKTWVIKDPAACDSCETNLFKGVYSEEHMYIDQTPIPGFLTPCVFHCTLMEEIFDLNLCNDCYKMQKLCQECESMIDR